MERTEVLDMMSGLKLYGMRSAYDETLATALKRKHEPQRFVGDLLKAEISEKQARSSNTSSRSPSFRWPRTSTTSRSTTPRSTRLSCAISLPVASSPSSATLSWSVEPAPARRIWPSPSREAASAPDHEGDFSPPSISSISLRLRPAPAARHDLPIISPALTLSFSTNSAISLCSGRRAIADRPDQPSL